MDKEKIIIIAIFAGIWLIGSLYEILFKKKKTNKKDAGEVIEGEDEETSVSELEEENGDEQYSCPYCGSLNLKSDLKCTSCGAPLCKKRRKNH